MRMRNAMTLHSERLTSLIIDETGPVTSRRDAMTRKGIPIARRTREVTVLMSICVSTCEMKSVRETLHRTLGAALGIYTVSIDNRRACATLQVEVAPGSLQRTMAIIMRTLPEAEFGAVRPSHRGLDH
jgi:hypothetical protein